MEMNEKQELDALMEYFDEIDLDQFSGDEKNFCAACLMGECIAIFFKNRSELR